MLGLLSGTTLAIPERMLLPLLATAVIVQGTQAEVEIAFHDGIRARLTQDWVVADLRTENDELAVTLVDPRAREPRIERHVMHIDGDVSYRVEDDAKLPIDPREVGEFTLQVLSTAGGGIELGADCGGYVEVPYLTVASGTREVAGQLVAWTLATAEDLRGALHYGQTAIYELERDGNVMKLHVWLDRDGHVLEAQLRRYGETADVATTYKRTRQLARALRGTRVTQIASDGKLVTPRGRVAIDPHGTAFAQTDHGEYEGCGC
jgi:hypothetical protein